MKKFLSFLCVSLFILVGTAFGNTSEGGNTEKSGDFIEQHFDESVVEVVKSASVEQMNVEFETASNHINIVMLAAVGTKANEVDFETPVICYRGVKVRKQKTRTNSIPLQKKRRTRNKRT